MGFIEWIGFVGSLFSIGAAIWSFFISKEVKKAKSDIYKYYKIIDYSKTNSKGKETIAKLRQIANQHKVPRGFNTTELTSSINSYIESLSKISVHFEKGGEKLLKNQILIFKQKIFSASKIDVKDQALFIETYTEIYNLILSIESKINDLQKNNLQE